MPIITEKTIECWLRIGDKNITSIELHNTDDITIIDEPEILQKVNADISDELKVPYQAIVIDIPTIKHSHILRFWIADK